MSSAESSSSRPTPPVAESAILVLAPNAEALVGPHRTQLDVAAAWGIPAHVTLLYPWIPPQQITAADIAGLADLVSNIPAFTAQFSSLAMFGEEVLYLVPSPHHAFETMLERIHAAYPDYPPYEGRHPEVVPHLTIGHCDNSALLHQAYSEVWPQLPVDEPVTEIVVMCGGTQPGSWTVAGRCPLGPPVR